MKIKSILTTFLFCTISIITLHMSSVFAEEDSLVNNTLTIFFWNTTDIAGTNPFMSISFLGITDEDTKKVMDWQKEIQESFNTRGGILKDEDYLEKMPEVLPDYMTKFLETKTKVIMLEFPRRGQRFLLQRPEPLKQKTPSTASIQSV